MLNYMETGDATDETTRYIDNQVEEFHFDGPALADYLIRQMQQRERDMASQQRGMERGMKQGLEQGMKKGRVSMLNQLIESGDISLETAAVRMGVTVEVFKDMVKECR